MNLELTIHKIKSVDHLDISLPTTKGLYAITGKNGSGKSTIVTCASSVFYTIKMKDYFGETSDDSYITCGFNGALRSWRKSKAGRWLKETNGQMEIKGFYEGSIIFGNRFRNTSFEALRQLDKIDGSKLSTAEEFVRKNLGKILHNDENYYEKLFQISAREAGDEFKFRGEIYFYERGGRRISQFHMSTGENLLVSVLHSIQLRNSDRANLSKSCVMFLDEIELALHPSSLKRLLVFLKQMSDEFNYSIYFSTHSIELIGAINPRNIFFINRHADGGLEVINPCYPAYATRILYDHSGYDQVFLVEDDLAKAIVDRVLRNKKLLAGKLVHILPCGGYTNVIDLAKDVVDSNLVGKMAAISVILDGDVEQDAHAYIRRRNFSHNVPLGFLPIESLEKFLRSKLYTNVDQKLFRALNDFIFHQVSLGELLEKYRLEHNPNDDRSGKRLFKLIDSELTRRGKSRADLAEICMNHLLENEPQRLERIATYLESTMRR